MSLLLTTALCLPVILAGCGDPPPANQIEWNGTRYDVSSVLIAYYFDDPGYDYQIKLNLDSGEEVNLKLWDKSLFKADGTYSSTFTVDFSGEGENTIEDINTNISGAWNTYLSEEVEGSVEIDIGGFASYADLHPAMDGLAGPIVITGSFTLDDGGDTVTMEFFFSGDASFEEA